MSAAARTAPPGPAAADDAVLEIEHLAVGYGGGLVLADVQLRVGPGEVIAILGANGSGKSTLVKTILGIVPPTSGDVRVFGVSITDRRHLPWRRIGYVPQRMTATSGVPATAEETVVAGLLDRSRLRPRRRWAHRLAHVALEQVGLGDRAHDAVQHLSGGQQQRVLLARALVRGPDLLMLDEPMAGMDQRSQEATRHILRELLARGTTLLVVLHEVDPLADLITRTIVLRHGRIVHDGGPPEAAPGHDTSDHVHDHQHPEHEPYRPGTGLRITP